MTTATVAYSTALLAHRPPHPGDFCGILPGLEAPVTDPKAWPAAVKAAPSLTRAETKRVKVPNPPERKGQRLQEAVVSTEVPVRTAELATRTEYAFPARVYLTELETKWLGAWVLDRDDSTATRWSVWALSPTPGYVWLTQGVSFRHAAITDLVQVGHARQPELVDA